MKGRKPQECKERTDEHYGEFGSPISSNLKIFVVAI